MKKFTKIFAILLAAVMVMTSFAFAGEEPMGEKITITFVNSTNENSAKGAALNKMLDYIEENSAGTITFNRFFGGSVCSAAEEYSYLKDGAFDMCCPEGSSLISSMPFLFGCTSNEGWDQVYDMWQTIFVNDPETSEICHKYAGMDGVTYIGPICTGMGCLIGKIPVKSNADVAGHKFGAIVYADYWETQGAQVVNTTPMDLYDSLSRGVYEFAGFALSAYAAMSLNEVAPYVLGANEMQSNGIVLIRQETYDKLSDAQKAVLADAAKVLWDTCVENAQADETRVAEIAEEYTLLDIDTAKSQSSFMELNTTQQLLSFAKNLYGDEGEADMLKIRTKEAEMNGLAMIP